MNSIIKFFTSIFKAIYTFIDKVIVTPISKIVYKINDKLKNNQGKVERFLNRPYMLVYISLIFAVGIFFFVDSKVISLVQTEAEILVDQPVKVQYNKEAYVIEGIPETVDITLIGRKSDLYLAKQLGDHEVILDLTDYEEGTHKVRLTLNKTIESLNYKLDPSVVTVNIKKRISTLKTISYDLLNNDKLDPKLSVSNVLLSKSEVVVKGSAEALEKVASVKALIDLSNPKFVDKGKYEIDNVNLVAYDENGKVINNVDIIKGTITATVDLTSYSTEVPIRVITTGNLLAGKAISQLLINGKDSYKVTIYGDQNVLDTIGSIPVTIDINDQGSKTKTYNVTLTKPSGVRYISETSATISLEFGDESQRTLDGVNVESRNLAANLKANIIGDGQSTISVQLKGIQSIIDAIESSSVKGYVDLNGYTEGVHEIKVIVEGNDPRVSYLATKTLTIKIENK